MPEKLEKLANDPALPELEDAARLAAAGLTLSGFTKQVSGYLDNPDSNPVPKFEVD